MATTGKIAEVLFEKTVETYEQQMQMLKLVDVFKPNQADMQNSNNVIWRTAKQHAPIIEGWDISGQETDIIKETYPAVLGVPKNDFVKQRADDLRDMQFWEERGEESGRKQATELNKNLAQMVALTGSLFFRSNATSGYDFVAEAQAIMNERELPKDAARHFVLNDRTNLKFAKDLAGRQTLQGRPESTWIKGQIGENVAEFDLHVGSYLPNLIGGVSPDTPVTADISNKPTGGTVDPVTKEVLNTDYRRSGVIPFTDASSYNVGDKIVFDNGGTLVESVGLADKNATGQPMTFTIVSINGNDVEVFPKPIALDDPALSTLEKAYANIDTQILTGALATRLNIDASAKVNPFWAKDSIEVTCGDAPIQLLNQFGGMKVVSTTMANGQIMYMAYDGNIDDMSFKYRLFTWYETTNKNPSANGVGVAYV